MKQHALFQPTRNDPQVLRRRRRDFARSEPAQPRPGCRPKICGYSALVLALISLAPGCGKGLERSAAHQEWRVYKGDLGSSSYSSLDQINRANVGRLQVAWTFRSGDERLYTIECNPIVIDGIMYLTTPMLRVFALDAATGEVRWRFDPSSQGGRQDRSHQSRVNRGVSYWSDGREARIFFTYGTRLHALDARTGRLVSSFADNGILDLRTGLDRDVGDLPVRASSPGVIYRDLLIQGSSVGEGPGPAAPGHIRAFDVRTGERRWIFHTIPHPGEEGYETWPPDAWKTAGGANAWAGFSLDEERGLVFAATGSASYDHYGGDRPGQNLFANCVLALQAGTGKLVWYFQAVHHDIWDYDLASPPNLVSVRHNGQPRDAVAQVTKMGHLFLLDRTTGTPLFPVEERPVRQSTLPGERSWPTQPFPVAPPAFARQGFGEEDVTDRTPEAAAFVRKNYLERYGPSRLFDPPSREGVITHPQFNGGTDWGGAAFDSATGILYLNTSNEPEMLVMKEAPPGASHAYPYLATGHLELYDHEGFPISKPPWGTLNAIDLNVGTIAWQVPLGTHPELVGKDYPDTGSFNMGGPIVTAGGLVFIGAAKDAKFRAFDKDTGKVLWEHQLDAGGYATPATYMVNGKQYVIIAAGGGGKVGTASGDAYVAFSLP